MWCMFPWPRPGPERWERVLRGWPQACWTESPSTERLTLGGQRHGKNDKLTNSDTDTGIDPQTAKTLD